jgi:hypothetical protein
LNWSQAEVKWFVEALEKSSAVVATAVEEDWAAKMVVRAAGLSKAVGVVVASSKEAAAD